MNCERSGVEERACRAGADNNGYFVVTEHHEAPVCQRVPFDEDIFGFLEAEDVGGGGVQVCEEPCKGVGFAEGFAAVPAEDAEG